MDICKKDPRVQIQSCPPPPQIPNAQNMTSTVNYRDGEKISVLCQEKYLIRGAEEIVCKDGRWQSIPRCVDSTEKCGPPPPINNGDITSFLLKEYPTGSRVEYQCQSFYELQGSKDIGNRIITCWNGEWSKPPKCLGKYFNILMGPEKTHVITMMFCCL
uniref:Sushi domain-containing protein n=1 Tax=Equus asinus asinus TaxID=83772 RepID=A0A8C4L1E7_EQUAS